MGSLSIGFVGAAIYDILPSIVRSIERNFRGCLLHYMNYLLQIKCMHFMIIVLILDFASTNPDTIIRIRANSKTILYVMFTEGSSTCRKDEIHIEDLRDEPFVFITRPVWPALYDTILSLCRSWI